VARYITPEALLSLRYGDRERPQWDVAVLCFRGVAGSGPLIAKLNARPLGIRALYALEESGDRPFVYEARLGATRIAIVTQCLWGGPQTAILVEELACLGVRAIVGFGVAGSLVVDLPKGTQIVAAAAIVTDGTSRAYTDLPSVDPDAGLARACVAVAERSATPLLPVPIATVDALYRETPADVARWLAAGALAINMESTPLYAASAVCGVRAVWLGHVSDSLASQQWESWVRPAAMTEVTTALTVGLLETLAAGG
jgi:uridine phosphorylase